jgi:hypothetical protein
MVSAYASNRKGGSAARGSGSNTCIGGELITTTLSEVGKQFSESSRTPAEIEAYAEAMADMFCAYLDACLQAASGQAFSHRAITRRAFDRVVDLVSQFVFAHLMEVGCQ